MKKTLRQIVKRVKKVKPKCPFCGCKEPYEVKSPGEYPSCPHCNAT